MRLSEWIVRAPDNRPIGPVGCCTHCQLPLGEPHKPECVIRDRTVVVKVTFEYVMSVPEDWDQHLIEFARNEGSWCADNLFDDIADETKRPPDSCMCGTTKIEYVREATEDDEELLGYVPDERERQEMDAGAVRKP